MNKIELNPYNYSFPNFCFEKKFNRYLFLDSAILSDGLETENYFFEILRCLETVSKLNNDEEECKWELLIPNDIESRWGDYQGNSGIYKVAKGTFDYTLNELKNFFLTEFYEKKQSLFIQLVDEFWIGLRDDICVYALYNGEIIVIGYNAECDLSEIKNKEYERTKLNIDPSMIITTRLQDISHEIIQKKAKRFFYKSFDEYVDHWGPVFRWSKQEIGFLKQQFI